jgi:hypothetical protein
MEVLRKTSLSPDSLSHGQNGQVRNVVTWAVLTHSLQVRSACFVETKMVKEFHANYRTQMIITVFTRAHQLRGPVNHLRQTHFHPSLEVQC